MRIALRVAFLIVTVTMLTLFATPVVAGQPTRQEMSQTFFNDCAPQDGLIRATGFLQLTPTQDGSTAILLHFSGVSATGVKYQIHGTGKAVSTTASFSETDRLHVISQSSSDNLFETYTVTYDPASGYQFTFAVACRG